MSNYTAREVNIAIGETETEDKWGDISNGWDVLYNGNVGTAKQFDILGEQVTAESVAKHEESDNSGYGESIWVVVKIGTQFFKKAGYTSSYDSDTWDGACAEVRPRDKMVTVYE